jgi:hypothetical protein
MTVLISDERLQARATGIAVTRDEFTVELEDGRTISVPLKWFPRLMHGTPKERKNVEISEIGLHWPDLDEDISIKGLLLGNKSGESASSLKRWLDYHSRGKKVPVKTLPLPAWAKKELKRNTKRTRIKQ